MQGLARACGVAPARGRLRCCPEDFQVEEIPLLEPGGGGEHAWLLVRKRLHNTADVATRLARCAGVRPGAVSYAGLKDRQAVTEQWFSVHLPGRPDPDWAGLESADLRILRSVRHGRKLRRGALRGNRFRIVVRELDAEPQALERRLQAIASQGVPNYFGEQRFGRAGSNLRSAGRLFANPRLRLSRQQRGLALSAARALLFNAVLDRRVRAGCWDRALAGDALQLHGSHSYFVAGTIDAELQARLAALDVHPTGPLYGRGAPPLQGEALALESAVLADYPDWLAGLEAAGLEASRRPLRLVVDDLQWRRPAADELQLAFALPAGGYATSVLRELVSGR